jgi:hypothetical protein
MQEALRNINSQILSPRDKFFLKKNEAFFYKEILKKLKSYRGYRDSIQNLIILKPLTPTLSLASGARGRKFIADVAIQLKAKFAKQI